KNPRRVTLEAALLRNVNTSRKHADLLAEFARGLDAAVNVSGIRSRDCVLRASRCGRRTRRRSSGSPRLCEEGGHCGRTRAVGVRARDKKRRLQNKMFRSRPKRPLLERA
ncbi:MAG: hypothetical protein LBG43_02845, partial [Treponema sp.]|nr:hypothetical protein [Treponema sp.]